MRTSVSGNHSGIPILNGSGISNNADAVFDAGNYIDNWWEYTLESQIRITDGGSTSYSTTSDIVYYTTVDPTYKTDNQISIIPRGTIGTITYTSTSGVTVSVSGLVTHIHDGESRINMASSQRSSEIILNLSTVVGASATTVSGNAPGSLREHSINAIDSRLSGKTVSDIPIYTTQDHVGVIYTRNTTNPFYDIDLTCISPWNSTGGNTRAGTLITPKHIIFANHYPISIGATIRFVTQDNTVVTRTLSSRLQIGTSDLMIGLLDSDVPETITFAKILPSTFATKLPIVSGNDYGKNIPVIILTQEEKTHVNEIGSLKTGNGYAYYQYPTTVLRSPFARELIVGDSGNPAFLLINGELVVITTWYSGGGGGGPGPHLFITELNAAITSMGSGGGYTVTHPTLTSFNTY